MPKQDKLHEFNLASFYGSFFAPARAALSEVAGSGSQVRIDYEISAFFECFWWLNLGVELDYFPERKAAIILKEKFWNDSIYEDFLVRNPRLFPGGLITLVTSALESNIFFDPVDNYTFSSPETLQTPFQFLLMQAQNLARNSNAQYFVSIMNFGPQVFWDEILRQSITDSELISAVRMGPANTDLARLSAGYLRSLQYILSVESYINNLRMSGEIEEADVALLVRRVKDIQIWRLNFRDSVRRTRFEQLGILLNRALAQELNVPSDEEAAQAFRPFITDLMSQWDPRVGGIEIGDG